MKVKDHFLTQEEFELVPHPTIEGILQTHPLPKDIAPYYNSSEYISHENSKTSVFQKVYAAVQKVNTNYKLQLLKKNAPTAKSLLDYGCGKGDFLASAAAQIQKTYAHEPNKKAKQVAQNLNPNTTFLTSSLDQIPEDSLDVITLWHVFEHLGEPEKHVQLFRSKLKKNGILVLALPNYMSKDAKLFGPDWAAFDVPRHLNHYSPQGITQLMEKYKLKRIANRVLWFDAFYISLISSNYKKNLFYKIISPIIGLYSNFYGLFSGNYSSHIYIFQKITP